MKQPPTSLPLLRTGRSPNDSADAQQGTGCPVMSRGHASLLSATLPDAATLLQSPNRRRIVNAVEPAGPAKSKRVFKGRKPVSADPGGSATVQVRIGMDRLIKFHRMGGAAWLRAMIDAMPMPDANISPMG